MINYKDRAQRHMLAKKSAGLGLSFIRGLFLVAICFVILYPLLTKVVSSFMTIDDVYDPMVRYIPKHFTLENFKRTMNLLNYKESLLNSLILAGGSSLITVAACTVSAYGLARFKFKGNNFLFITALFSLVVTPDILLVPYYLQFRFFDFFGLLKLFTGKTINLSGSFASFFILGGVCMGLKNGLYLFVMRQFFKGMPKELEEAAYVDGSGLFRTFIRIMLPGSTSMLVTVFLFSFVFSWLDVIYTPVFLSDTAVLPTQIGLLVHSGLGVLVGIQTEVEFSLLRNAGMILIILPLIILYLFAQRFFVQSIERSGLTG